MSYIDPPIDSADARERREAPDPTDTHPPCVDGWLGEDDQGRPRPCLTCRPHLKARPLPRPHHP